MLTFSDWSAGNFAHRSAFGCRHSRHSHAESDHTQIHGVERRKAGPALLRIRAIRAHRHLGELRRKCASRRLSEAG